MGRPARSKATTNTFATEVTPGTGVSVSTILAPTNPSGITAVALAVAGNQGITHIVAASSAGHVTGSSVLQPCMIARVPIVAFFTIE